jgi:hypothetical protein
MVKHRDSDVVKCVEAHGTFYDKILNIAEKEEVLDEEVEIVVRWSVECLPEVFTMDCFRVRG